MTNKLLALAFLATWEAGCAARLPEPQASEMKCVEKYDTRDAIDLCRFKVRQAFDGGSHD